jgi:hypothetical protein
MIKSRLATFGLVCTLALGLARPANADLWQQQPVRGWRTYHPSRCAAGSSMGFSPNPLYNLYYNANGAAYGELVGADPTAWSIALCPVDNDSVVDLTSGEAAAVHLFGYVNGALGGGVAIQVCRIYADGSGGRCSREEVVAGAQHYSVAIPADDVWLGGDPADALYVRVAMQGPMGEPATFNALYSYRAVSYGL